MGNFIKVNRKILKWEWWSDINTFRLFMYMLLEAFWKDGSYKGKIISRGSFPSSIAELSRETNLTENEIRTAIKHLKSTGEITSKSHSKFTVFTVKNYDLYQSDNEQNNEQSTGEITSKSQSINEQITSKSQTDNKQITGTNIDNINNIYTEKEDKKERKEEYIPPLSPSQGEVDTKQKRKQFVPPTVEEVRSYCVDRGNDVDADKFVDFYESKGWYVGKNKMKDWKAAVRTWENKRNENHGLDSQKKKYYCGISEMLAKETEEKLKAGSSDSDGSEFF